MNRQNFHVKKGDQVQVITGNHKGATGKVLQVLPKKQQVLIEGVRLIKKHVRKSQDNPKGGVTTKEFPIAVAKVMLQEKFEARKKKRGVVAVQD